MVGITRYSDGLLMTGRDGGRRRKPFSFRRRRGGAELLDVCPKGCPRMTREDMEVIKAQLRATVREATRRAILQAAGILPPPSKPPVSRLN